MNDLLALQPIAKELAQSRLHAHRNPADVLFVLSAGQALGLNAATALMNIYNVNGMPSLKADLKLALAKNHPEYNGCEIDATPDRCIVKMSRKRKDGQVESVEITFSMQDAIRAELAKKDNWRKYPQRMLKARAISYAVNDLFPDIVFGMMSQEEADDMAPEPIKTQAEIIDIATDPEIDEAQENAKPEPTKKQFDDLMSATQMVMGKLMSGKINGYDSEIHRHESAIKHLGCDYIRDCTDYWALYRYHNHLVAALRGENAKPTIAERKISIIDRMTNAPLMAEELEEWCKMVQDATRHNVLDQVEAWLNEHYPLEAK